MLNPRGDAHTEFYRLLIANGAEILRQKNHLIFKLPDGQRIVAPKTPSDKRAWKNALAFLRRALKAMEAKGRKVQWNPGPWIREFWAWLTPSDRAYLGALPTQHHERDAAYQVFLTSRRTDPDWRLPSTQISRLPWRQPDQQPLAVLMARCPLGHLTPLALPGEAVAGDVFMDTCDACGQSEELTVVRAAPPRTNPIDADCRRAAMGAIEKYLIPLAAGRPPHARDVARFDEDFHKASEKGYVTGLRRALISVSKATSVPTMTRHERAEASAAKRREILRRSSNPPRDYSHLPPIHYPHDPYRTWQPPGATPDSLSPGEIQALMRRAGVTMRDVAMASDLPLERVRELHGRGALGTHAVYDMIDRINRAGYAKHLDRHVDVSPTGSTEPRGHEAAGMFLGRARMHHKGAMARKASYVDAYQRLLRQVQLTPADAPYYQALVDGLRDLGRALEGDLKVNLGTLRPAAQPNPWSPS